MEISKINSLVELFFKKLGEVDNTKSFLNSLKSEKITYSWKDVSDRIFKLSSKLKTLIKPGDRCLILSENNPNWFISDISIMNAGGISVPIFTTTWWAKRESNSHFLRNTILSRARLPVPPFALYIQLNYI